MAKKQSRKRNWRIPETMLRLRALRSATLLQAAEEFQDRFLVRG
jgi:uncharacterized membrane protein YsdA (DUF1294 family)